MRLVHGGKHGPDRVEGLLRIVIHLRYISQGMRFSAHGRSLAHGGTPAAGPAASAASAKRLFELKALQGQGRRLDARARAAALARWKKVREANQQAI